VNRVRSSPGLSWRGSSSITIFVLAVLVAIWAFVIGFAEITQAWRLWSVRRKLRGGTKATREGGYAV
jgi:uncharacterized protein HemY